MPKRQNEGKKGSSRKVGRSKREPKHTHYNQVHGYVAFSNPKATHHRTPLEKYNERNQEQIQVRQL